LSKIHKNQIDTQQLSIIIRLKQNNLNLAFKIKPLVVNDK